VGERVVRDDVDGIADVDGRVDTLPPIARGSPVEVPLLG
jgi:hypothetical protein